VNPTSNWLNEHIWPQIHSLMLNDAYFKLAKYFFNQISKNRNVPIETLILDGYLTFQMIGIRRLCDNRKDVISLRRLLVETGNNKTLSMKLDKCDSVCNLTNDHIAHKANPLRQPDIRDWNLTDDDLTEAQKSICEVALALDRVRPKPTGYVKIIPVITTLDMRQFNVSDADMEKLWDFWHWHNDSVNAWIYH
jgi:hypothetical protein